MAVGRGTDQAGAGAIWAWAGPAPYRWTWGVVVTKRATPRTAQAMSRAVRWGDAAYIEGVEQGRKNRRSLIERKRA
jgi:hypothetical protein